MLIVIIAVLIVMVVVLFCLWRSAEEDKREANKGKDYYRAECQKTDDQIINIGHLLNKGWTPVDVTSQFIQTWRFQASDEQSHRTFNSAVARQRKLDEIANYNLPKEYAEMKD